jgi:type II secretory pathway pseudopilin PulG
MDSFCAACGNSIAAGERFCRVCGREATAPSLAAPTVTPQAPSGPAQTSGKAIVSLVCGLLVFIPLAFVAAIVFGHIAMSEIRRSAGRLKGEGIATAGLVLGYAWIVGIPIVLIIAAIAIPNLLRAKMAANESSAVAQVRTLVVAETTYANAHSDAGFTCSLSNLAEDKLISSVLAGGAKSGYTFELLNCSPAGTGAANMKFQVVAHPVAPNQTGIRAFCSDESAVIKVDSGGSAQGCLENGTTL